MAGPGAARTRRTETGEKMRLLTLAGPVRTALAVVILSFGLIADPGPAGSQSGSNPTAEAVQERQLLEELGRVQGRITIPDQRAMVLQQPQGRDYRAIHEAALPWLGAILIIGMLAVLAGFYFYRGRIRTLEPETGVTIERFNWAERFTHWVTATAFVILAITGLNYVFGKRLLMPLIGPDAFSAWSQFAKYTHTAMAWLFMAGVVVMFALWIKDNIPDRYDLPWLKAGGGMFDRTNRTHPSAARFNAGQKMVFWAVVLGGIVLSASGILLLLPFRFTDVNGMQLAQIVHSLVGMIMIAIILAHIYIGTLGMVGAFDAMGSGQVSLTWAKEHHKVWVDKQQAKTETGRRQVPPRRTATSAR